MRLRERRVGGREQRGVRLCLGLPQRDDRVLFGKYSGTEIKLDGTEYLILREDEILGIITEVTTSVGKSKK